MLSGNGRHRRPRQAPAIVVAAGVTGASIAIPLFGATGAQAAPASTWDRVAECESAGMWSANEGNGFYGGLQLTLDMWKKYGGTSYAPRPDLASRSQQISVAESILGDRGPDAWPSCALNAGLSHGGDAPDVNPGSTAPPPRQDAQRGDSDGSGDSDGRDGDSSRTTPDATDTPRASHTPGAPDASDERERPDRSASASPDGPDGDAPSPSPSTSTADPSPTPSDTEGGSKGSSGKHRGERDRDERPSGHASRGGTDRDENPSDGGYTVRPGDNLSAIAEKQELGGDWRRLYASNEKAIGTDPDLIVPGQRLDLTIRGR
ncbi:transglycosylase family protein [Streptomyces sp. NPDC059850]|uniref:transglycosylase family protein n=1 Tax=Streptomyces sp. NPDC059850 TaxID=3346970 RepID=UPI00364AAC17